MWLVSALGVAARFLTKYIVTKALLVLGLGFVTYQGVDTLVDAFEAEILAQFSGLPADVWNIAVLCGVDVCITITISAVALALQIRGITAGARLLTSIGR